MGKDYGLIRRLCITPNMNNYCPKKIIESQWRKTCRPFQNLLIGREKITDDNFKLCGLNIESLKHMLYFCGDMHD